MKKPILIIGGYGVFGGRIAMALAKKPHWDVIVTGRSLAKASRFCKNHGGRPLALDLNSNKLEKIIAAEAPFIIIDAAGPYQAYGADPYRIAKAAMACGAHYLDLSDDADFTKGIQQLAAPAQAAGVTLLSGVSSVPALSSAAVDELARGIGDIHVIESVILPGNRAPRGLSVMRAILLQVGRPMQLWRGGKDITVAGWSRPSPVGLEVPGSLPIKARNASFIGAPDLALFPQHYGARSVLFRAGLELKLMHGALTLLSWLAQRRLIGSPARLTRLLKWLADHLEGFGSDRGGMVVRVAGLTNDGRAVAHDWTLIAEAGDGPHIPTIAARILCQKLLAGEVAAGARPCLGEFTLQEAETALAELRTSTQKNSTDFDLIFAKALGRDFNKLPQPLRDLHCVIDARSWAGKADIQRGNNLLAKLIGTIMGFPPAGRAIPVAVTMERQSESEIWVRQFGSKKFRSRLSLCAPGGSGRIFERFGPLRFTIDLCLHKDQLAYPITGGSWLGIPLPRFALPKSETREYVDDQGRACFDVRISMPLAGHIVTYRGWLKAADGPLTGS